VIAQNPGEPWAYKEVGLSELYLGKFQEAMNWFEKADQIGPRDPSRWIWLGAIQAAVAGDIASRNSGQLSQHVPYVHQWLLPHAAPRQETQ
jgi:tetratricopeptide (TPR) repeat protein